MKLHDSFEWDDDKAAKNLKKHRVSGPSDVAPASDADMIRLRMAMDGPVDPSDIPEQQGRFDRLRRDSTGRLPTKKSLVRDAILRELKRLNMTPYRLWKEARTHCPTLSQSAVHEFIKGQRQLELPYAEALMAATHLGVVRVEAPNKRQKATSGGTALPKVAAKRRLN
jgi:hypothetical protein